MPASIVSSFAKKTNKSEEEVERLWNKAKDSAEEQGHKEDYDYIVGILKRMLKLESEENNMKIINSILEEIDIITFEMQFSESLIESLLTEDLERIASDMWRRTKKAVMTAKKPEVVMKKVIKLTQAIATKAGYKNEDIISWYYDEIADEEIPGAKRKGKLWHEWFAKVYKKV